MTQITIVIDATVPDETERETLEGVLHALLEAHVELAMALNEEAGAGGLRVRVFRSDDPHAMQAAWPAQCASDGSGGSGIHDEGPVCQACGDFVKPWADWSNKEGS